MWARLSKKQLAASTPLWKYGHLCSQQRPKAMPTKNPDRKTQREKFEEAARELKTDQSDEAFEAVVNKIAHAPKLTAKEIKELVRRKREADGSK